MRFIQINHVVSDVITSDAPPVCITDSYNMDSSVKTTNDAPPVCIQTTT